MCGECTWWHWQNIPRPTVLTLGNKVVKLIVQRNAWIITDVPSAPQGGFRMKTETDGEIDRPMETETEDKDWQWETNTHTEMPSLREVDKLTAYERKKTMINWRWAYLCEYKCPRDVIIAISCVPCFDRPAKLATGHSVISMNVPRSKQLTHVFTLI